MRCPATISPSTRASGCASEDSAAGRQTFRSARKQYLTLILIFPRVSPRTSPDASPNGSPANPTLPNDPVASFQASDPKVFYDDVQRVWTLLYFCNGGTPKGGASICIAFSDDQRQWSKASAPLYNNGGHPGGLDSCHAHKVWLTGDGKTDRLYLYYTGVTGDGCGTRGILLLTSTPMGDDATAGRVESASPAAPPTALSPTSTPPPAARAARAALAPHPRIILTDARLAAIKGFIAGNAQASAYYAALVKQGDYVLTTSPFPRPPENATDILMAARTVLTRVTVTALLFRLTGDERYAARVAAELLSIVSWQDWDIVKHALDAGELSLAAAVGLDWVYAYLQACSADAAHPTPPTYSP